MEKYEALELEIIRFDATDVIITSGCDSESDIGSIGDLENLGM